MGEHHELHRERQHLLSSFDLRLHLAHLDESVFEDDFGHPLHSGVDMCRCSGDRGELRKGLIMKPLKMPILADDLEHLQLTHSVDIGDDRVDDRRVEGLDIELRQALVELVLDLLENLSLRRDRRMSPLPTTPKPTSEMQHGLVLDVVVAEGVVVLELLVMVDQALVVLRDALLVLDDGLHGGDGVRSLDIQGDDLARRESSRRSACRSRPSRCRRQALRRQALHRQSSCRCPSPCRRRLSSLPTPSRSPRLRVSMDFGWML